MKTFSVWIVTVLFATRLGAVDGVPEQLQRGLFEEEANRNLDAAIKAYQGVVNQSDQERKVVATALFRLAECYRKLGKTNEAYAQYQRVLRDFSDQDALVALSQSSLPRDVVQSATVKPVTDPAAVELLRQEIALAEKQVLFEERKAAAGKSILSFVLEAKRNVLRLKRLLPENATSAKQREVLQQQIELVTKTVREWERKVEVGTLAPGDDIPAKRELLGLQRELAMIAGDVPKAEIRAQSEVEETIRELKRRMAQVRVQCVTDRMEADRLNSMSQGELLQSDAAKNDQRLVALRTLALEIEQKLADLKTQFGDEHPEVRATQARRKIVTATIADGLSGLVTGAQMRATSSAEQLKGLEQTLAEELKRAGISTNGN